MSPPLLWPTRIIPAFDKSFASFIISSNSETTESIGPEGLLWLHVITGYFLSLRSLNSVSKHLGCTPGESSGISSFGLSLLTPKSLTEGLSRRKMFKGSFPPRILDFKGFTHMSLSIPRPWMKMMAGLSILPLVKEMSNFIFLGR